MEKRQEKGSLNSVEMSMKVNFKMANSMKTASISLLRLNLFMKEILISIILPVLEKWVKLMVLVMREILLKENMKVKEKKHGLTETSIQEGGKMVSSMDQEKLIMLNQERKLLSNGEKEKNGTLLQFKKRRLIQFFIINLKKN